MAQQQGRPILELSTLAPDRPLITIDGARFEIAVPTDFGLLDEHKLKRLNVHMSAYYEADEPTEEVVADMIVALDQFCRIVILESTPEVVDSLTEGQQLQVVEVFTNAAGWTIPPEVAVTMPDPTPPPARRRSRRTSATSSPGSNGSTDQETG